MTFAGPWRMRGAGHQAAQSALEAARALLGSSRSEREAQAALTLDADAAWRDALGDEGFDGEAAYRAALMEEAEENAMAARLARYESALSAAEAALASLAELWEGKQAVDGEASARPCRGPARPRRVAAPAGKGHAGAPFARQPPAAPAQARRG